MNLCRNWGGSFGIAFVTTMLECRTQYHQSVLVSHLSSADGSVRQFVSNGSRYLLTRGTSGPDAIHQAYGLVSSLMMQQATMLAAMDCFHLLGVVSDVRPADGRAGCELSDKQRRERGPLKPSRA